MARTSSYREPKALGEFKLTRRQWLMASAAAAIAACAPSPGGGPAGSPSGGGAVSSPVRGGVLRVPIFNEPLPLNPVLRHEGAATTVMSSLFSQLTRIDPATKEATADLATGFEVAKDGLSWVFHLQEKAKWHDGADFTADDVVYTFGEVFKQSNASPLRSVFASITKTEKVDRNTIRFVLKTPLMSLPVLLAVNNSFGMLPKHILEGQDLTKATKFNTETPIGTGPFKLKSIAAGSHVELTAFDDFFRGRPYLDGVIWKIVPDANVRIAQLKSGELHWDVIDTGNLPAVANDPTLRITEIPTTESNFYQLNYRNPLFQDARVRQALIIALDRQAMMQATAGGRGKLMAGTIPPAVTAFHNADVKPYPYDPEKAKALLAQAGWRPGPDGIATKGDERLSFRCTFDSTAEFKKQLTVLAQQYWRAVGIDAQISEIDRAVYSQELQKGTFVMTMTNRRTPQWDPDVQRRFYHSKGGSNFGKYSNPKIDALLEAGAQETDPQKRKAIYREYDSVIFEDAHVIHGYFPDEVNVHSKRLLGIPDLPGLDAIFYMDKWYLTG